MTKTAKTTDDILLDIFIELQSNQAHAVRRKFALISTPRCGSSMFCDVLTRSGVMGDPKEWINFRYVAAYGRMLNRPSVDLRDYLSFVLDRSTTPNGVWSINFHVEQYIEMKKKGFDVFQMGFEKIYYLYRKDKVAQAYSLAKASLSDQWSSDALAIKDPVHIDRVNILQALVHIAKSEAVYKDDISSRVDAEFVYEEFSDLNRPNSFQRVLQDMGEGSHPINFDTDMKVQRTSHEPEDLIAMREYLLPA